MRDAARGGGALSRRALTLGGTAFVALAGVVSAQTQTQVQAGPVPLSAPDAAAQASAGEILLIDVRTAEELAASGSPAEAAHADMRSPGFGERIMALVDGDRSRPVAFICARGARSGRVSAFLAANGFTAVYDVSEGMMGSDAGPGWLARGLPVRSVAPGAEN